MSDTQAAREAIWDDHSFFGHPKALLILFFTEMWERFSYYGMRALLIFYLTQHFLFSDQRSAVIYGAYTALVYVMPVIGGTLADRYLGSRKAVTFGAILLVMGHFGMAFEGSRSTQVVSYEGASYEMVAEGRGDDVANYFVTEDGATPVEITGEGIVFEEPAARPAALPATIPAGDYELSVQRNTMFLSIFYLSLALIISGVGFLKANISTIVGDLYRQGDPRRDGGFTIFYMGINLGAASSSLLCGWIGIAYGWAYGFGLAGIGMLAGLLVFLWGQKFLADLADPPDAAKLKEKAFGPINKEWAVYIGGVGMVLVSWILVMNEAFVGDLLNIFGLFMAGVIIYLSLFVFGKPESGHHNAASKALFVAGFAIMAVPILWSAAVTVGWAPAAPQALITWPLAIGALMVGAVVVMDVMNIPAVDRDRMLLALFLICLQLPFWALFEQAGSSLNLFTGRVVDRSVFGLFEVPAPVFQSLNAIYIFMLAPIFAWLWIALAKRGREPNTVAKFGLGIFQLGLGFLALVWGINMTGPAALVPVIWIFVIYLLHTMGELCLSPVGLSAVTKLSVPRIVGMMMGAWFLASGFGNYLAGIIAASTGAETVGGEIVNMEAAKAQYAEVYMNVGIIAVIIAVIVVALSPFLKRLGHGRAEQAPRHTMGVEAGGPSSDPTGHAP